MTFVDQLPGALLLHSGIKQIPNAPITALLDDVLELAHHGLVRYQPGSKPPNGTVTVTPLGTDYHDQLDDDGR